MSRGGRLPQVQLAKRRLVLAERERRMILERHLGLPRYMSVAHLRRQWPALQADFAKGTIAKDFRRDPVSCCAVDCILHTRRVSLVRKLERSLELSLSRCSLRCWRHQRPLRAGESPKLDSLLPGRLARRRSPASLRGRARWRPFEAFGVKPRFPDRLRRRPGFRAQRQADQCGLVDRRRRRRR